MPSRRERLAGGLRHDPEARRKSQRHGKQRGVTITVAAAELAAAGIDPDSPPPEYRVFPGSKRDGGMQLRFYRV
jgi:hypothetical protein